MAVQYAHTNAADATGSGSAAALSGAAYLALTAILAAMVLALIAFANLRLNPLIYDSDAKVAAGAALASGRHLALFDVNVDMRGVRREQIKRLTAAPDVVIFGGSHWQEALPSVLPGRQLLNLHVHRDYVDDALGLVELLAANDRLPRMLILSARDLIFQPAADRPDHQWLNFHPEYSAMAKRLGFEPRPWPWRDGLRVAVQQLSVAGLWSQTGRMLGASERPGAAATMQFATLDVIAADGAVRWSPWRQKLFTPEYAHSEVRRELAQKLRMGLIMDPAAVEALDLLLGFLKSKNVKVVLAHPPFHPRFHAGLMGDNAYGAAMREVEAETRRLAAAHGARVIGNFDALKLGCTEAMFIDAQHANPDCLARVLAPLVVADVPPPPAGAKSVKRKAEQPTFSPTAAPPARRGGKR
jgi:hypothetical protein